MGSKLIVGVNDLESQYPAIASEWDVEENYPLLPANVAYSCNTKYSWICPKGHRYKSSPNSRTNKGSGCKYCANKAVLIGYNDLVTTHPVIAAEWDYELNGTSRPEQYTAGSDKVFYWKCPEGHKSYRAPIKQRKAGRGCKICGHKTASEKRINTIIDRRGSFLDLYPELAEEWDYETNIKDPNEYTPNSNKKVMWICSWCNGKWPAKINARVSEESGCPHCNNHAKTSFPEQALFFYLKKVFPDAERGYTEIFENKMELDIYIPSRSTAIEYDGLYWHDIRKNKRDELKYHYCKERGIRLIRVRETAPTEEKMSCDLLFVRSDPVTAVSLNAVIAKVFSVLSIDHTMDIDSERDRGEIKNQYVYSLREKSLEFRYPEIAKEWHPHRNGTLSPDRVSAGSGEEYWWICGECGEEYKQKISQRTGKGVGCKKCSTKRKASLGREQHLEPGVNDLKTMRPDLIEEWDWEKNKEILPQNYTCGSDERVNWICRVCGYHWPASIYSRTTGSGCPVCGRRIAGEAQKQGSIKKYGSLVDSYPLIAAQWDYEENIDATPNEFSPIDRSQEFHWICECGKKWESNIFNLTHSKYVGCSSCRHKKLIPLPNSMRKEKRVTRETESGVFCSAFILIIGGFGCIINKRFFLGGIRCFLIESPI